MPQTLVVHPLTAELLEQRGLSPGKLPVSSRVTDTAVYRKGGLLGTVQLAAAAPPLITIDLASARRAQPGTFPRKRRPVAEFQ